MPSIADEIVAMGRTHVLVVGDALLDQYVRGLVERVSPEAPVPVVHQTGELSVLGGAANVAANVAALGAEATLCARVGDDPEARRLTELLERAGIAAAGVVSEPGSPTPRKTRVVAGAQQIVRIDREDATPAGPAAVSAMRDVVDGFLAGGATGRAIIVSDYGKGGLTPELLRHVLVAARAARVPVVADPKGRDLAAYAGATVLKPNREEARVALGHDGGSPEALCSAVLETSGVDNVVLSLSADGVVAAGAALDGTVRLRSQALQVADVSGAGDTLVAVLAVALAAGAELGRAVELGNVAAGRVCAKSGTATLPASELLEAFKLHSEAVAPEKWIADREVAAQIAARQRADGRRIVFANGCFDVLHAGHVRLLHQARAAGDALIVALNTDESIRRLKGPTRPAQTLSDRVAVLAALASVDLVVAFDEDTPLALIEALRPAVIVKGGDYRPEDVVGAAEVERWGGRVEIVPLLDGRSSTKILRSESLTA